MEAHLRKCLYGQKDKCEKKVSTRVRGAAWRLKDAPKARGVSFWERHGGMEEKKEEHEEMPAGEEGWKHT